MRTLRHALLLLCLLAAPGAAQDAAPAAPDGRPGLAGLTSARELARAVASPEGGREDLLVELTELQSDLLVLREMARRHYLQRGDLALLGGDAAGLEGLHELWRELEADSDEVLRGDGPRAELLARLLLDLRFQLRVAPLELAARESAELRRGLALLRGSLDGFYDLKDSEARVVAGRLDLAAAVARAARSDLDALRERGDARAPGAPDPALARELDRARALPAGRERVAALAALRAELDRRRARLASVLFWPRLEPRVTPLLDQRSSLAAVAAQRREATERVLMVPPYDADPPPQVQQLSRSERYRFALSEALRGLDADPLDEDLTYWAAVATDELYDPRESRAWFDRYLALRGIRVDREDTLRRRELTEKEQRAVEEVMQAFTGPGPR